MAALEVTGLDELIRSLEHAGPKATVGVVKAAHVFGGKVKKSWRGFDSGLAHAPRYPFAIDYDLTYGPGLVEVVVGPDKGKPQGALGNLIEYGSSHNPPHGSGARALALHADDLERGVAVALEQAL